MVLGVFKGNFFWEIQLEGVIDFFQRGCYEKMLGKPCSRKYSSIVFKTCAQYLNRNYFTNHRKWIKEIKLFLNDLCYVFFVIKIRL